MRYLACMLFCGSLMLAACAEMTPAYYENEYPPVKDDKQDSAVRDSAPLGAGYPVKGIIVADTGEALV